MAKLQAICNSKKHSPNEALYSFARILRSKEQGRNRSLDQLKEGLDEKVRHVTLPLARLYIGGRVSASEQTLKTTKSSNWPN